jgi:hypothetical protein
MSTLFGEMPWLRVKSLHMLSAMDKPLENSIAPGHKKQPE